MEWERRPGVSPEAPRGRVSSDRERTPPKEVWEGGEGVAGRAPCAMGVSRSQGGEHTSGHGARPPGRVCAVGWIAAGWTSGGRQSSRPAFLEQHCSMTARPPETWTFSSSLTLTLWPIIFLGFSLLAAAPGLLSDQQGCPCFTAGYFSRRPFPQFIIVFPSSKLTLVCSVQRGLCVLPPQTQSRFKSYQGVRGEPGSTFHSNAIAKFTTSHAICEC